MATSANPSLLFTSAELRRLAQDPRSIAIEAISRGAADEAAATCRHAAVGHEGVRDGYVIWFTSMCEFVTTTYGPASRDSFVRSCVTNTLAPLIDASRPALRGLLEALVFDGAELDVRLDEDELVVTIGQPSTQRLPVSTAPVVRSVLDAIQAALGAHGISCSITDEGPYRSITLRTTEWDRTDDWTDVANPFARAGDRLAAGELAAAHHILRDEARGWTRLHDAYRDAAAWAICFIDEHWGIDAVEACIDVSYDQSINVPTLTAMARRSVREQAVWLTRAFHHHEMVFDVEETGERIAFHTTPCGSGGRLIEDGRYGGATGMRELSGPHPLTFGRPSLPAYCVHCPSTNRMVIDGEWPPFLLVEPDFDGEHLAGHCTFTIYKSRDAIPVAMRAAVGRGA